MSETAIGKVLWDWNVTSYDLAGKLEAAEAGKFDVLTVPYRCFRPLLDAGTSAAEILAAAEARGVSLDFLDGMTSWCSIRYPPGNDFVRQALDFSAEDALAFCDALGLRRIVAVAGFEVDAVPPLPQLIDEFGGFCERAATEGIWVDLEPMAMMGINTLALGWEIVREAGAPNSGLMFDTWHFMRAQPDLELLAAIPRGKIRNVQIVDGGREPIGPTLWDDVWARTLPGEGEFALADMLTVLRTNQDLSTVGPEAVSNELAGLPPAEVGARACRTTSAALIGAGFADPWG
jgi:sugar phosphate isomerase/epimerase